MSLWKVPIGGGETEQISEQRSSNIAISPDNISFAHFGKTDDVTKIFVRSFGSEENLRVFDLPEKTFPAGRVVWTKDGQDLIYAAEDTNLVGNLWLQPLAGGPPQKLTNFTTDEIFAFDLSPEGSDLAIIRGTWNHNVVLARELLK
jgi:Tol biopolymer transport system component